MSCGVGGRLWGLQVLNSTCLRRRGLGRCEELLSRKAGYLEAGTRRRRERTLFVREVLPAR